MLLLLPDTKFSSPYGWIDTGRASPMQRDLGPDATAQKQSSYIWLTDGIQPTGRPGTAPLIGEPKRGGERTWQILDTFGKKACLVPVFHHSLMEEDYNPKVFFFVVDLKTRVIDRKKQENWTAEAKLLDPGHEV
ncbi:hypothetical protein Y1Q_0003608 [Alligator mississippiensis]|uniref:Uncharacterized protein n=1 Tax=Alligator mississippiensis TaxID=8496 RepID=A0A151PFZ8_ALLMI|nr:hypothetical protein Y1Q_0003608 [Alligator mississippiensis]